MKKFLLIALLYVSACGFSPLYQEVSIENGSVPVKTAPIPGPYGFTMRQTLQNKLGNATNTLYTLTVSSPSFSTWDQTIDDKNFATMMGITGTTTYVLMENKTHKEILKSSTSLTSSYSVVKDPYTTTVAAKKVQKELSQQLAEQISLHVLGTLSGVHH